MTRWKTTGHVTWVPPSCQHRHGWTRRRNKLDFLTKSDFTKRPHLRAIDKRYGSHKLSSFRCLNLPGKATGTVRVQTDFRTQARRKSKSMTGGYSALRRCGCLQSGKGTRFHCLKFHLGSAGEPTICSHCYDVLNEDCWSLRCSWSIACRRCSNYIFILDLTPDFNGLDKDNCNMRWEIFKCWDLAQLILRGLTVNEYGWNPFSWKEQRPVGHIKSILLRMA